MIDLEHGDGPGMGGPVNVVRTTRSWRRRAAVLAAALMVASGCGSRSGDKLDALARAQSASAGSDAAAPSDGGGSSEATDPAAGAAASTPADQPAASSAGSSAATPSAEPSKGSAGSPSRAVTGSAGATVQGPGGNISSQRSSAAPAPGVAGPRSGGGAAPTVPAPGSGGPSASGKKAELLLGTFGVGSGVVGTVFQANAVAIRAWTSMVNARGGVAGHPVRVIFGDDGGDSARTQATVRRMVEQDHVVAFFGEYSATIAGVLPYLEQKGVPILGSYGADIAGEHSPMYFNPGHGPDSGKAWGFINTILTYTDKKKLGILYCREVQACSVQVQNFKKLLPYQGLHLVYESQVSLAQPDYTAEMLAAQRAGAEVLVQLTDAATVARMNRAAERQNYHPIQAAMHQLDYDVTLQFSKELEGLIAYGQTASWQNSPKMQEYRDAINRYQPGGAMGDNGAMIFVDGKLLEEKVAPFLKDQPSSADFLAGLHSIRNEKLGGLLPGVTWTPSPDKHVNLCVVPVKLTNGKLLSHDEAESFVCPPQWKPE